ncbi:UNVERIFIED_CONTAM: hypothetical protein K2H54_042124 [Gekko kuhli]
MADMVELQAYVQCRHLHSGLLSRILLYSKCSSRRVTGKRRHRSRQNVQRRKVLICRQGLARKKKFIVWTNCRNWTEINLEFY